MILLACAVVVACLLSGTTCAPLACENLIRPLVDIPLDHLEGTWALVGSSLNRSLDEDALKTRDSVTFVSTNSTFVQRNRIGDKCQSSTLNVTKQGHVMTLTGANYVFTATFHHTSCETCLLFRFDVQSASHNTTDLYIVSTKRELDAGVKEEFAAQAKCLGLPEPIWMDPTKELCQS
uniref:Apolipoprotein M n=1 Tax=Hippocampus comes TaxID=109280 RepID=A0A3Q3E5K7_HIPCM